jgi:hypothetical protein
MRGLLHHPAQDKYIQRMKSDVESSNWSPHRPLNENNDYFGFGVSADIEGDREYDGNVAVDDTAESKSEEARALLCQSSASFTLSVGTLSGCKGVEQKRDLSNSNSIDVGDVEIVLRRASWEAMKETPSPVKGCDWQNGAEDCSDIEDIEPQRSALRQVKKQAMATKDKAAAHIDRKLTTSLYAKRGASSYSFIDEKLDELEYRPNDSRRHENTRTDVPADAHGHAGARIGASPKRRAYASSQRAAGTSTASSVFAQGNIDVGDSEQVQVRVRGASEGGDVSDGSLGSRRNDANSDKS